MNVINVIYEVVMMVSLTLSVPQDLKQQMDKYSHINWSEVARKAIIEEIKNQEDIEMLRKFTEKSTLTQEDAIKLGKEINKRMSKRLERELRKDETRN